MAVHAGSTGTRRVAMTMIGQGHLQHYGTIAAQLQQLLKNKMVRFLFPDFLIP
jgi:hypothetical protein